MNLYWNFIKSIEQKDLNIDEIQACYSSKDKITFSEFEKLTNKEVEVGPFVDNYVIIFNTGRLIFFANEWRFNNS